jgi:hypothetical protein
VTRALGFLVAAGAGVAWSPAVTLSVADAVLSVGDAVVEPSTFWEVVSAAFAAEVPL